MRKQAIRTPRIAGPKMLWSSKMAFLCSLTWSCKQRGENVFLLNQVKVKKLPKQAAAAEGVKPLLTKWGPQLRQAELCHIQRQRMGLSSSSTASLQNYTSNSAEHTVLFTIPQHALQVHPKQPTLSHRRGMTGSKIAIHSCCVVFVLFFKNIPPPPPPPPLPILLSLLCLKFFEYPDKSASAGWVGVTPNSVCVQMRRGQGKWGVEGKSRLVKLGIDFS